MSIEILERVEELSALEEEWDALADETSATPFQRPAWLLSHLETFGGEGLHAIVVRRGAALIGLLPLRAVGPRELSAVGEGISDYFDAIARPEAMPSIRGALAGFTVHLSALRPDALLQTTEAHQVEVTPVLDLERPLPSRMRDQIRYYRRRAERAGVVHALATDRKAALESLFALHGARWNARGQSGVLADADVRRFHHAVARRLRGMRLHLLRKGDRVVGALYVMLERDTAYYYLGGFAPELAAIAPGTCLIAAAIDDARAHGARTFDFLRGGERYKYAWGAVDRPLFACTLTSSASDRTPTSSDRSDGPRPTT